MFIIFLRTVSLSVVNLYDKNHKFSIIMIIHYNITNANIIASDISKIFFNISLTIYRTFRYHKSKASVIFFYLELLINYFINSKNNYILLMSCNTFII